MRRPTRARRLAGAFLLSAIAGPAAGAERLRIAAERPDRTCPPDPASVGIVRLASGETPSGQGCIVLLAITDLSDSALAPLASTLARLTRAQGLLLDFSGALPTAAEGWEARIPYAVKTLSSAVRSSSPEVSVAVALPPAGGLSTDFLRIVTSEELAPYVDALALRPGERVSAEVSQRIWALVTPRANESVATTVLAALAEFPQSTLVGALAGERPLTESDVAALDRLQRLLTPDVSRDPTATRLTRKDGSTADALRFFHAKTFTPILLLREDPAGEVRIALTGGPYDRASVENLATGARRDFDLKGGAALNLDLSPGPLAVVLRPAARKEEAKAAVEVGAIRGLTAEEIIARERAWDAGQRDKVRSYIASMSTSLRFRVAEFPESLDLTILGPFFFERGKPGDWGWQEFYLNGVKWKGRTIPKLPILQPEKVTTLPLDIRLTEEYDYALAGETSVDGRAAYRIAFRPREAVGDKPIYRGTAWIDKENFALLRRESIQLNLKGGDTLSNVQTEFYRSVPGQPEVVLPLEIRGQQVFSTAGRTTAVERYVVMRNVEINPPDFAARLKEAYASKMQMVRDTDDGLRYLVPDPAAPQTRIVEQKLTRKSLFGLTGAFYQRSNDYPLPLLGVQYFDFDLFGKNKQLSIFFAGAILFGNYTDPALFGGHFDLGADVFGIAFPFVDQSYRSGTEIKSERIKHLPEFVQVNLGRPIGPYLKASLGLFTEWDNYQRHSDTGPDFITPVDTFTNGAELRLSWNQKGYNLIVKSGYFSRSKWEPWGDPATSGYDPKQKDYWRYSAQLIKGFYFPGYRKLGLSVSYLDGTDLDRFSRWDFGPFGSTRLAGFPSGSVRADRGFLANLSYGINVENVIRFELVYDQALVTQKEAGYDKTYFSGVGLITAMNGPWDNTRLRAEIGYPVVAHGVKGFTINLNLLKLF